MFVVEINTCKAPTRSLGLGLGLGLGLDVAVAGRQRALNFFFFLPFTRTFLCKSGFLLILCNKTKHKNNLELHEGQGIGGLMA